jgi:serine/threonine-protein kinase
MAVDTLQTLDKYIVLEDLGKGANSSIKKVQDPETGLVYTLKHVEKKSDADNRFFEQAETEYEVSRNFDHPFLRKSVELVRIRKWLKTQELLLVMEYVEGQNLKQAHLTDIEEIIDIFIKVSQGLSYLHRLGFVHADIKPKNILLIPEDGIKIIDFGQTCPIGHRKIRIQGTPDYMAPEQVERSFLDQRTDIFSLGATFYEVITNTHFQTTVRPTTDGGMELTAPPNIKDIQRPDELNRECPVSLSKLVMDCCNFNIKERPENMREVIARLEVAKHLYLKQKLARPATAAEPAPEPAVKPAPVQKPDENYDDSDDFEKFIESIL